MGGGRPMGAPRGGMSMEKPFYEKESDSIANARIQDVAGRLDLSEKQLDKMVKLYAQEFEEICRNLQMSVMEFQMRQNGGFRGRGNNMMDAFNGTGDYVDNAYENINAMFGGLSKGFFQVVVLDNSPIQSMADLKGKKVCMGPAGNAAIILADLVWGKYGFSTADIKTTYVAYDDGISQLEDGNVDAVYIQTAIPASAIQQLAAGGKAYRLLSVDEDIANELCEEYGYFGYGTISTSVYDNMKEDVNTMFVSNMVAVRADLDEDLVYEMTKAIFENLDIIKSSHKAASGLSLETATRVSIPMHPGAERYFKEVGSM